MKNFTEVDVINDAQILFHIMHIYSGFTQNTREDYTHFN